MTDERKLQALPEPERAPTPEFEMVTITDGEMTITAAVEKGKELSEEDRQKLIVTMRTQLDKAKSGEVDETSWTAPEGMGLAEAIEVGLRVMDNRQFRSHIKPVEP